MYQWLWEGLYCAEILKENVVKKCPGDPLSRQLMEAKLIVNHRGVPMNDKNEWVRPAHIGVRGERV